MLTGQRVRKNKKALDNQGLCHVAYGRTDGDRTHDPYPVKVVLSR